MKKLAIAACAAVFVLGLAACSGNSGSNEKADSSTETSAAAAPASAPADQGTSPEAAPAEQQAAPAAAPVDVVDFDVADMSDEDAFNFMHDFTNRTPDELDADEGKVMHIIGQVSRYTKKTDDQELASFSVGIKGEGGTIWGVNVYVDGWEAADFPENKAQVEVTGVWGKVDGYGNSAGRTLICNAEDVKVLQ